MTEIRFVLAPGQNHFFFELAEALCHELNAVGATASISTAGFGEPVDDRAYVLLPPHEYFALEGNSRPPPPELLRRSIFISAEQPRTHHFHQNLTLAPAAGALFDINARAARAYRRRGFAAEHLRLGYTSAWDPAGARGSGSRDCDVLFLGAHTVRRARILAANAQQLAGLRSRLVLSDNSQPNPAGSTSFLAGEQKWDALRRSRVLLNVHQGAEPYFEWHRILQAIHARCAVLTETSTDHVPLVPGTHFAMVPAPELGSDLQRLTAGDEATTALAGEAYDFIRDAMPLRPQAERLAAVAAELSSGSRLGGSPRARLAVRASALRLKVHTRRAGRREESSEPRPSPEVPAQARIAELPGDPSGVVLALGPEGQEIGPLLAGVEPPPEQVLLLAGGQMLLAGAAARLRAALAASGVSFSYGLVATGTEPPVANPFGWEEGREVALPVLTTGDALRKALEGRRGVTIAGLIAALAQQGEGGNVQTFVAAAAKSGDGPPPQSGGVPAAVGDA